MTRRSCSWCHETNVIDVTPAHCGKCGHRADVPRMDCDCPRCARLRADPEYDPSHQSPYQVNAGDPADPL